MDETRSKVSSRFSNTKRQSSYLDNLWFESISDLNNTQPQTTVIKPAPLTSIPKDPSSNNYVESGYIANYFK